MEAYRTSAVVQDDGTIVIGNLPFDEGQRVEVIRLEQSKTAEDNEVYDLRGEPVTDARPFDSVAEEEWEDAN